MRCGGHTAGGGGAGAAHGAIHAGHPADAGHRAAGGCCPPPPMGAGRCRGAHGPGAALRCAAAAPCPRGRPQPAAACDRAPKACFCPVLQRYGRKAMRSAYDTISTAVENAPGLVAQPQLAQVGLGRAAGHRGGCTWSRWHACLPCARNKLADVPKQPKGSAPLLLLAGNGPHLNHSPLAPIPRARSSCRRSSASWTRFPTATASCCRCSSA